MSKLLNSLKFVIKCLIYIPYVELLLVELSCVIFIFYPFGFIYFIDNIIDNISYYLLTKIDIIMNKLSD